MTRRMLTVYFDDDEVEIVRVEYAPAFLAEDPLARADLLVDVVHEIEKRYTTTVDALYADWRTIKG